MHHDKWWIQFISGCIARLEIGCRDFEQYHRCPRAHALSKCCTNHLDKCSRFTNDFKRRSNGTVYYIIRAKWHTLLRYSRRSAKGVNDPRRWARKWWRRIPRVRNRPVFAIAIPFTRPITRVSLSIDRQNNNAFWFSRIRSRSNRFYRRSMTRWRKIPTG